MATATKPQPLKLETPLSATFPSEIQSPALAMSPMLVKREDMVQTPISPPIAYLSFLSKVSTTSPPPSASLTGPDVSERPALTSQPSVESVASTNTIMSEATSVRSMDSTATDNSQASDGTEASNSSTSTIELETRVDSQIPALPAAQSVAQSNSQPRSLPAQESTVMGKPPLKPPIRPVSIPKSPFSPGPESACSLRRLHIPPQSPYSPRMASPSMTSPMLASPLSAGGLVSPYGAQAYSPRDREFVTANGSKVGMRQTITRYISVPSKSAPVMEPVPASKKRKIEQT